MCIRDRSYCLSPFFVVTEIEIELKLKVDGEMDPNRIADIILYGERFLIYIGLTSDILSNFLYFD